MTDLICFKVKKEFATRVLKGLEKSFYTSQNVLAVGEPLFKCDEKDALFFCPVMFPVGGIVKKMVSKQIIKGFKSSFAKKGISLEKVRSSKKLEDEFDELKKEEI